MALNRETVLRFWDRAGIIDLTPAPLGLITGPVAAWQADHIVVDVSGADEAVRIALGNIVDDRLFVEAPTEPDRKLVLIRPDVSEQDALQAAGADLEVVAVGPSGWRNLKTGTTHGLSSDWTDRSIKARQAAELLGLPIDNLYPLDDDIHNAVERVEQGGGTGTARDARKDIFALKREWATRTAALTTAWDLVREAKEAHWNSPEQVAHRETIAQLRELEAAEGAARRHDEEQKRVAKAEKARLRRAKAAEARARNREARRELEAAGWPKGWSPSSARNWEQAGGTPDLAQLWAARGFSHQELIDAAAIAGAQGLPELEEPAEVYRELCDSLVDFAADKWPIPPRDTALSIKSVAPDGTRRRVCVTAPTAAQSVEAFEWLRGPTDASWRGPATWRAPSLEAITEIIGHPIWIDSKHISQVVGLTEDSLDLLTVKGEGVFEPDNEWADTIAAPWADELDRIDSEGAAERLSGKLLPVCLGPGLALGSLVVGGRTHHVIVSEYYEDPGGTQLAHSWWYSEPGGAPVSWDGHDYATQIAPELILFHTTGDVERGPRLHLLPRSDAGLAQLLADWIEDIEAAVSAAISLEPLDPQQTLSSEDRDLWEERLDGYTAGVDLNVNDAVVALVRSHLARDAESEYSQVAAALASPNEEGAWLGEILDANSGSSFAHI